LTERVFIFKAAGIVAGVAIADKVLEIVDPEVKGRMAAVQWVQRDRREHNRESKGECEIHRAR